MGIVVIGATFVDIKGFPLNTYIADGRNAGRIEYIHGGVSHNVAMNIANCGLKPTFLSIVDNTGLGTEVLNELKDSGIDTQYIRAIDHGMGTWLAIFDTNGDLAGSISQRPDMSSLADLLDEKGDEIFSQCDSIVIEYDLDRNIVAKAVAYAKKYNKKIFAVIANMSLASKHRELMSNFDCFVCNRQEAGIFFAEDYNCSLEEMGENIKAKMKATGINSMVVTSGKEGAVYINEDGNVGIQVANVVQAIDTTGAGDAFFSGVVIGLTYGKSLAESVVIGTNLASAVIVVCDSSIPKFKAQELGLDID